MEFAAMAINWEESQVGENLSLAKELGGIHWGFLPALISLPLFLNVTGTMEFIKLCLVLLASLMASYDLVSRRIPNVLTGITAIFGLICSFFHLGLDGLFQSLLGGLTGFGLMAIFFFIGAIGAGDVKAMGALGTMLNPLAVFYLFIFTTLAGGLLALAKMLSSGSGFMMAGTNLSNLKLSTGKATLPYGLAIWAGTVVLCVTGLGL